MLNKQLRIAVDVLKNKGQRILPLKDEILNYWEMCDRQRMGLQRGMYFKAPPAHGVILMSRLSGAPYDDEMSADESTIIYEGHDAAKNAETPDPKQIDQPRFGRGGKPTENGKFASWIESSKRGNVPDAIFRVYEKMRTGVWTDRGLYLLKDYAYPLVGGRKVFKFRLDQAEFDTSASDELSKTDLSVSRQIPSWVKQYVYKRDNGRCVICNETDHLHFDHDFPFSKGGSSISPENVRILCARHNLAKSANIE